MLSAYAFVKRHALPRVPSAVRSRLKAWHYVRRLRTSGPPPEHAYLATVVRAGDTVVDIGANFGHVTTALAALVGPTGRVLAIEPMPETFDTLCRTVHALGLTQVTPIHAALSDSIGTAHMTLPDGNYYLARLSEDGIAVPMTTLDALTADLDRVSCVKCDVEGHEVAVLRGAHRLLTTDRPAWLIEVWGQPTFDLMAQYGYQPFTADAGTLRPWRPGDDSANVLFRHAPHVTST